MARWFGFLIFISIFTGICLGGNYYILSRLFGFFNIRHNIYFRLILVFLAFGYPFFSILSIRFPSDIWNVFLRLSAIGLGVGWLCFIILLSHDLLHLIFQFPITFSRWVVLATIASFTLYSIVNAMRLEIKEIEISAPENNTIIQWSDIHLGSVSQRHLERLVEKTNTLNPDIIVITGDLIEPQDSSLSNLLTPLNRLAAPVYCIAGNHERYLGLDKMMAILESTSVIPLRNEAIDLGAFQLVGIDDSDDRNQVQQELARLQPYKDKFTILLYHQPEGFEAASKYGVNIMLSGHTHNGQIWPFNWLVRTRFQYVKGLHKIGDMFLYISTGSGTWGPPMRLGSRNQITLIRLVKGQ